MQPPFDDPATRHARVRMQQRGIRPAAVDALLAFGRERHDGRGAVVLCLDGAARRALARTGTPLPDLDRLRGYYVVIAGDGAIVTVGHRKRPIRPRARRRRRPARRHDGTA